MGSELCIICGREVEDEKELYTDCGELSGTYAHDSCMPIKRTDK